MNENRASRIRDVLSKRQLDITILLENVFDPHNISAVMRTCDSVGIGTIHTLYTQQPPHNLTGFRSSAGTWKWIKTEEHHDQEESILFLKQKFGRVVAAHLQPDATPVFEFDFTKPVAIVFGNEQNGCSPDVVKKCDGSIYIPQTGMVKSLNISVACAVILYEAFRQKFFAGHYNQPALSEDEMNHLFAEWSDYKSIREKKMKKP
ncbi:MAG: RNA methyltransferase [Chitinophagaceae bacterium]|nr:RNA methyltransferase [Chitinophagaceae bacterium]